ncbi:MAG TPA: endonuclease domain-containing protein [Rhizomicrobium sp.]|nr:endonuclease domain-containing protein [Rhizomicrobium sp.]
MKRALAVNMRVKPTVAEQKLWAILRSKRAFGLRFRRQQPIGPYVVDFYCSAAKLIVELDGGQHGDDAGLVRDEARTRWLNARGYRVLRFWNGDFMQDPDSVFQLVLRALEASGIPLPEICEKQISTLPQGEG